MYLTWRNIRAESSTLIDPTTKKIMFSDYDWYAARQPDTAVVIQQPVWVIHDRSPQVKACRLHSTCQERAMNVIYCIAGISKTQGTNKR